MSDFENRVSEMFTERADAAPTAEGLAGGARTRQRQRRNGRVALAAGAVIAAIVAVPVGLGALSIDGSDTPAVSAPTPEARGVPAGWRWESYRDLEFAVPKNWVYGNLSQHCISSNSNPAVERWGGASTLVACGPALGYGVIVSPADQATEVREGDAPVGSAIGSVTDGGVTLTVIAPDQVTLDGIVASARVYPGPDYYGCEAEATVPALGDMVAGTSDASGPITVCRYDAGIDGPNLTASEVLEGDVADGARLGLESLAPGAGPEPKRGSCLPSEETQAVLLRANGADLAWVHYDGCTTHGVDVGGEVSQLNAQIVWTALGRGWSGALGGEIPLPREPRFVG